MSNDTQGGIQIGNVAGNVSLQAGGDIVAGNKTVIQNIIQEAVKKITTSPYKFLASYDISDRDIFYGRSVVIEELAGKVPRYKTLIINGASGSGKSSLLNAGLIPRLAENGYTYVSFREYSEPLQQLRDYLSSQKLVRPVESGELEKISQEASLLQLLHLFKATQNTNLVVIFDQFERFLVNVLPEKRRTFTEALKQCMESNLTAQEMNFLFVLRQDFFGQMVAEMEMVMPNFLSESAHFNLQPLSQKEACSAITCPLEKLDVKIMYDEYFVNEVLLADLTAHSAEHMGINPPHLQIVCNQLYEAAYQRLKQKSAVIINAKLYQELGGTQAILQTYLDRTVENIAHTPEKTAIVRSMLKAMIDTIGTRKFVSLEDLRQSLPDVLELEIIQFLEKLCERRIIEVRQPHYSLSHEFMVEKVKSWFDEREMARQQALETLERGTAEWQISGALLNEKQVNKIRKWLSDFTEDEQQLLAASEKAYTERKRHEEEQKRQLAASKAARKRVIIAGISATFTFAIISLFFAIRSHYAKMETEYAKIETEKVTKERTLNLFESQLTQASLLAQSEDYAEAKNVLEETYGLDEEVPAPHRHARNLLGSFSQIMGNVSQQTYEGANEQLETIAISPDGLSLVAGGENGALVVFDTQTGQIRQRLKGHQGTVADAVFHPQGKWLATVEKYEQRIFFWSLSTGQLINEWPTPSYVFSLAVNSDGTYLASDNGKDIILWDAKTGKQQRTLSGHNEEYILERGLAFHPTKPHQLASNSSKAAILWNVNTGKQLQRFEPINGKTSITFSPDGKFLAAGCYDKNACFWAVDTGKLMKVLQGHKNQVLAVRFVANGRYLLSASLDHTLRFWDVETGVNLQVLQGHTAGVSAITTDANNQLFSASHDGTVKRWKTNLPYQQSVDLLKKGILSSEIAPNGTSIALGFEDGTLRLYSLPTPRFLWEQKQAHTQEIIHLTFSANSDFLATAGFDKMAKLWKIKEGQLAQKPFEHSSKVHAVALSPNGTKLATATRQGQIGLFNLKTGQKNFYKEAHEGRVNSIDFNASGMRLVSGGKDGTRLWNINGESLRLLHTFPKAVDVEYTTFSPDDQWIASVSKDQMVHIYAVDRAQKPSQLIGHEEPILRAVFSPDSRQIATVSEDNTIRFWDLSNNKTLFIHHLPLGEKRIKYFDFRCTPKNCWTIVPFYDSPKFMLYELGTIYDKSVF